MNEKQIYVDKINSSADAALRFYAQNQPVLLAETLAIETEFDKVSGATDVYNTLNLLVSQNRFQALARVLNVPYDNDAPNETGGLREYLTDNSQSTEGIQTRSMFGDIALAVSGIFGGNKAMSDQAAAAAEVERLRVEQARIAAEAAAKKSRNTVVILVVLGVLAIGGFVIVTTVKGKNK